jgi:hypothetical protein
MKKIGFSKNITEQEDKDTVHLVAMKPPRKTEQISYVENWVFYGNDNLLPQNITMLNRLSVTNSGIINKKARLTVGDGVEYIGASIEIIESAKQFAENEIDNGGGISDLIYKLALDYYTFGGYCMQILWKTYQNMIGDFLYQDFTAVRLGKDPENPNSSLLDGVWISGDWANRYFQGNKQDYIPKYFPLYNPSTRAEIPVFLYYKTHTHGNTFYPLPSWHSAIKDVAMEAEATNLKLNHIQNNMVVAGVLTTSAQMTKEDAEKQAEKINPKRGTDEAGTIILQTNSGEKSASVFTPFTTNVQVDVSAYLSQAREAMISAHELPSPVIIGLPGGASLGGDGNTIVVATKIFHDTVIKQVQNIICRELSRLLKMAGHPVDIKIKNYDFVINGGGVKG